MTERQDKVEAAIERIVTLLESHERRLAILETNQAWFRALGSIGVALLGGLLTAQVLHL